MRLLSIELRISVFDFSEDFLVRTVNTFTLVFFQKWASNCSFGKKSALDCSASGFVSSTLSVLGAVGGLSTVGRSV